MNLFYYTGDIEQPQWHKTFKTYYQTYDKVMKVKFLKEKYLYVNRDNQEKRQRVT